MDIDSAFSKQQNLINWAKNALDDAELILNRIFRNENIGFREEVDSETGERIAKVFHKEVVPPDVEMHFTNALNNLRNAFDQMLFSAAKAIGKPIGDGHYPWADSPTQFEDWKLRNKKTGEDKIPRELWDTIRKQEPYPRGDRYEGGHTLERAIATYANRKHTVGLEVSGSVNEVIAPMPQRILGSISWMVPEWDPATNSMEILRWKGVRPQFNEKHRISFDIRFDKAAPAELQRVSALRAMRKFADHAQFCLNGLKASCVELSG